MHSSIALDYIDQSRNPISDRDIHCKMVDSVSSFILQVFTKINCLIGLIQILSGNLFDPIWNSSAEKKELGRYFHDIENLVHYFLYILLEAHVKHLVCLVKDHCFNVSKVHVSSVDMI